jgi:hypothetical protein
MSVAVPDERKQWPWTRRLADFLNRNRGHIYLAIIAALILDIGYWGFSNLLGLEKVSGVGSWVESTETAAAIGLAIGTLALASAGLLQARAAGIQLELAARQADRERAQIQLARVQMTPNLDFQVIESYEQPTTQDTIVLSAGSWYVRARLRNLGPGAAVEVQVTAFDWWADSRDLANQLVALSAGGPPKGPILTEPGMMPRDIVNVPFALMAGEARDFNLQVVIPPLPEKTTGLLMQTVVMAWAKNVAGDEISPRKLGLRIQFSFPTQEVLVGGEKGRRMIWRWLSDKEVSQIPGLPASRVSFRSGLGVSGIMGPPYSPGPPK